MIRLGSRALGVLRLARPLNCLIAAGGAVAGGLSTHPAAQAYPMLALAGGAVFLGVAGGNSFNDAVDADIDRVAHPLRPVPRGDLTPIDAKRWAWTWFGFALGLSFLAGLAPGFLALAYIGGLTWYETRLKQMHVWGHVVVSLVVGGVFVFGALAALDVPFVPGLDSWREVLGVVDLRPALFMGALAGLANLAREFFKSIEDRDADQGHRMTVALQWGASTTRVAGIVALAVAMGFALAAVPLGVWPAWPYIALVAPSLLCFAAAMVVPAPGRAVRVTKLGMAIALLGFVALVLL